MVKHVVMYKLKEEAKDKADELVGKFMSMRCRIEGLIDVCAGKDFKKEGRSYDVALIATLESPEALEKYAVRVGGGTNHRFNLSDGVLIKDNHIAVSGGIKNAVLAARNIIPHTLKIEVEVENKEQLAEALDAGADIIMLDNMTNEMMKECVKIVNGKALVEASGNMGEKKLRDVADTGVDIISIGALTHTIKSADISLKFSIS